MPFYKLFFHAKIMLTQIPFYVSKNTSNIEILNIVPHGLALGKLRSLLILQVKICMYVNIWTFLERRSMVLGLKRVHKLKITKNNLLSFFSYILASSNWTLPQKTSVQATSLSYII